MGPAAPLKIFTICVVSDIRISTFGIFSFNEGCLKCLFLELVP